MGLDSSIRPTHPGHDLVDDFLQVRIVVKRTSVSSSLPCLFDIDLREGVDQNIEMLHRRAAFERSRPRHLVLDVPHQIASLAFIQYRRLSDRMRSDEDLEFVPELFRRQGSMTFRSTRSSSFW